MLRYFVAKFAQRVECVNSGVMPIAEVDRVGIVSDGFHRDNSQRLGFGGGNDRQLKRRRGRSIPLFAASGAWASIAKLADRIVADLAIAPSDAKAIGLYYFELLWMNRHSRPRVAPELI
jgi:hypothetical protein